MPCINLFLHHPRKYSIHSENCGAWNKTKFIITIHNGKRQNSHFWAASTAHPDVHRLFAPAETLLWQTIAITKHAQKWKRKQKKWRNNWSEWQKLCRVNTRIVDESVWKDKELFWIHAETPESRSILSTARNVLPWEKEMKRMGEIERRREREKDWEWE